MKWKVVPPSISIDGRRWWVRTKTGVWNGGLGPHAPCHFGSSCHPGWPNFPAPMISADDSRRAALPRPDRHHQGNLLCRQPANHEFEHTERRVVRPMHVVDDAEQWPLTRQLGQQRQRRQADEKPVRVRTWHEPERHAERACLWRRQPVDQVQRRHQQLVQHRIAEVGLRFDTCRTQHAHPRCVPRNPVEQGALTYSRLASQDRSSALACRGIDDAFGLCR